MKKRCLSVVILVFMFLSTSVFAEGNNNLKVSYSTTVSETKSAKLYCSQIKDSIDVQYRIVGYYTYDANTGAIQNAYRTEVKDIKLVSAPNPIYNAAWRLDANRVITSQSVASNGSKATFTATINFNLVNVYGSVDIETFALPVCSGNVVAYAK